MIIRTLILYHSAMAIQLSYPKWIRLWVSNNSFRPECLDWMTTKKIKPRRISSKRSTIHWAFSY